MNPSRPIEVIQPTMRRPAGRRGMPLIRMLTIGAGALAIVLSVSLSFAANTDTCAMPLAGTPSTPCD